jgi:uncharacterized protein (UPF0332 family)
MTMEAEGIKALVGLQLEKAHRFLAQADEMYSMQYWDLAANRYYYACYHAVQGLFIANGLPATKKHSGTVTQFSLHFVKTGKVETTYGSFLARMMQLRQKADYNCAYDISEKDLAEQVSLSKDFIKKIEELLAGK